MKTHMTEHDLDALIAAAFEADTPPPPGPAVIAANAVRHPQERPAPVWLQPRPARIGWAAAGVFALVLGCAAGAASQVAATPTDLDSAFGSVSAAPAGDANAG